MSAPPTLAEWLREAPFSLCMSSGFFSFFAHTGLLSVMVDEGFLPSRVSGSSAGALVTGSWAGGVEPDALAKELLALERRHFWDPAVGFGFLKGKLFRDKVEAMLKVDSLEACRVPATISVFDVVARTTRVLDHGLLAPAICASCAVPGLFHPVTIEGRKYWDGGVLDRPGLMGVPEGERVLFHHIASRSPWRKIDSEALKIPKRTNMTTLIIEDLPRSGPFRLAEGRRAYDVARKRAKIALHQLISGNEIRV
ncbi:MAG: patatin-like phospholipase family protein [Polyangiaceae bacterium]